MRLTTIFLLAMLPMVALADPKSRVRHIRELIAKQQVELADTRSRLLWTWGQFTEAEAQIAQVAKERDGWQAWGNQEHERYMTAETRVAKGKTAILWRDIIIGGLVAAAGGYAYLRFVWHLPI